MPELPDVEVYCDALRRHAAGRTLERVRLASPFLLRSVEPPLADCEGREITGFRRIGKRVVWELEGELYLVLHLMIAGRLRKRDKGAKPPGKRGLAAFDTDDATFLLTEASTKKRASLFVVAGEAGLEAHDPGGLEVLDCDGAALAERLRSERHTLRRALTDPRLFSGIGGAYSDEILHRAQLSPMQLTTNLDDPEVARLFDATREALVAWTETHRAALGDGFPDKVTAFHEDMAVHGCYKQPCPVCGDPVQRIAYAGSEANYCATCQTGGKVLADRALSRLLEDDWPRSVDEWERLGTR